MKVNFSPSQSYFANLFSCVNIFFFIHYILTCGNTVEVAELYSIRVNDGHIIYAVIVNRQLESKDCLQVQLWCIFVKSFDLKNYKVLRSETLHTFFILSYMFICRLATDYQNLRFWSFDQFLGWHRMTLVGKCYLGNVCLQLIVKCDMMSAATLWSLAL